jgi:acetyl-CoA carboxylase biotin carboxyl carrier protein
MNFEEIERILELMREHDLAEFELESEGLKLRVRKGAGGPPLVTHQVPPMLSAVGMPLVQHQPALAAASAAGPIPADDSELEFAVVKSPIVGTFYRSSEPASAPFVDVGDRVKKDQVLCIIEAMKLMNEITSEYEGEIVSVYVENGKPVQYGERLFAIKTA